jgi:hypothetical protein
MVQSIAHRTAGSRDQSRPESRVRRVLRDNGLSLVLGLLFLTSLAAQSVVGLAEYNEEQREHHQPTASYVEYLGRGHFGESVFENWESEFLQMGAFVILTAFLRQKGSAESKDPDGEEEEEEKDERRERSPERNAPLPVRRGGLALKVYAHSLSLTFLALFAASFVLHAVTGAAAHNEQQLAHGASPITALEYVRTSQFWFESLQNWQSEFLAVIAMVVFTIFLRERGSTESKPVGAPNGETGK